MERIQSLTTEERKNVDFSEKIPGWGADLNPNVRPGVPRDKAPNIGVETLYPRDIEQQIPRFKIHKSTEHQRLTPVFGTSCPPSGLSGAIRDFAYTYSEGRMSHWLLLLLADRINVVEDLVYDVAHGRLPNVWNEMGLSAELKYNRKNFYKKAAIVGGGLLGVTLFMNLRTAKSRRPTHAIELA